MLKTELKERFKKHLYKSCSDESTRETALEFFDDFHRMFQNEFYTREDFDTIDLDGTIIEQDVVNTLFKDNTREKVSAIELYVELFCKSIKSIKTFDIDVDNLADGCYDFKTKRITLGKTSPEEIYYKFTTGKVLQEKSPKQYQKHIKKLRKSMNAILKENDEAYGPVVRHCLETAKKRDKETTYHELAHLFGIRVFNSRINMDCYIKGLLSTHKDQAILENNEGNFFSNNDILKMECGSNERKVAESIYFGSREIAEIANEVLSKKIAKREVGFEYNLWRLPYLTKENYIITFELAGDTSYNINYYILKFLDCLKPGFEDDVMKCKKSSIIKEIKDLEIDGKVLHDCKKRIIDVVKQIPQLSINDECGFAEILNTERPFNTILFCCSMRRFVKTPEMRNIFNLLTIESQAILVQAIKEKVTKDLDDKTVEKNMEFFQRVSEMLYEVRSYLLFPNEEGVYEYLPQYADEMDSNIHKLTTHSIKRFAEEYPNLKHIEIFNDLVNTVWGEINKLDVKPTHRQLGFFADEREFDARFRFIMAYTTTPLDIVQDEILEIDKEDNFDFSARFEELLAESELWNSEDYNLIELEDTNETAQCDNKSNNEDEAKSQAKQDEIDRQAPVAGDRACSDNADSDDISLDFDDILAQLLGE